MTQAVAPPGRPVIRMTWKNLAFLHWAVPQEAMRAAIPSELEIDTFEGSAYIGVVPFEMSGTRFMWAPPLPTATNFAELNLRTYVKHGAQSGVWFFSLDAASRLTVRGARATFSLPYFDARMSVHQRQDGWIDYASERTHKGAPPATFRGRYRSVGEPFTAREGTLEHFLTERYSLFSKVGYGVKRSFRSCLLRGPVRHEPWPLEPGECSIDVNEMFKLSGVDLEPEKRLVPDHVHIARSIDVVGCAPGRSRG